MRRNLLPAAKFSGWLAVSLAAFLVGLASATLPAPRPLAPCEAPRDSPREVAPAGPHAPQGRPTPLFTPSLPALQLSPETLRSAWWLSLPPELLQPAPRGADDGRWQCPCARGGATESR
jgi:hypothetical protein